MSNIKIVRFYGEEYSRDELWFNGMLIKEVRDLFDCPEDATISRDLVSCYDIAIIAMELVDKGFNMNSKIDCISFNKDFEDLTEEERLQYFTHIETKGE